MDNKSYAAVFALMLAVFGFGAFYFWQQRAAEDAPPLEQAAPAPPKPPAAAKPAIQHPIKAAQEPAALPPLEKSDGYVQSALMQLLSRRDVLTFLQLDGFLNRAVATVDNLGRAHAPPRLWPFNPAPGRFAADASGSVSADNARRYAPFVAFVDSVDTALALALYRNLYPLLQRAYEKLGFPGKYFNDRLVEVIDLMLATPERAAPLEVELTEVKGELKPARPWLRYEFSDPALRELSAGQKILLRTGPDNARRLKAKLAEIRRQVASEAVAR